MTNHGGMSKPVFVPFLAMLTVFAMLVGGCGAGGQSEAQKVAAARAKAREKAAEQRQRAAAAKREHQTAVFKECQRVVGPLDARLMDLNSRLSVGLAFAKYSNEVGSAKVAYDKVIRDAKAQGGISDVCINKVGTPLQDGLNAYIAAYDTWSNCINDSYCSFDKGSAALTKTQKSWAKADRLVSRADTALSDLRP